MNRSRLPSQTRLSLAALVLSLLALSASATWVPLRAYVHTPGLVEDYERACYDDAQTVKFGSPEGCGQGCQHIKTVVQVSSQYIYEGQQTREHLVGKPYDEDGTSTSPTLGETLGYSWAASQANGGAEFFEFEVGAETIVTKLEVYQGFNPGAVTKVEAFDTDQVAYTDIWTKAANDASSSTVSADGKVLTLYAQLTTKRVVAKKFKITLDTTLVVGYNTIDAVKVHGLGKDGKELSELEPLCGTGVEENCYYACRQADIVDEAASVANLNVVRAAVNWVEAALKVRRVDDPFTGSLTESLPASSSSSQMCKSLPLSGATEGMENHHADLAVIITHRPSFAHPVEARACARFTSSVSLKRPAVVHVNIVPGFAASAGITKTSKVRPTFEIDSQMNAVPAHLAVVDTITHFLYRAIGWDTYFRTDFVGYTGLNVTTEKQQVGTSWEGRHRILLNLPKLVQRAEAHFGASAMEGVELENSEGSATVACRGVCLESRVFAGEVMTAPPYARDAAFDPVTHVWQFPGSVFSLGGMTKSAISLAYFEETGWYLPNYLIAESLAWGRGAGNDFVKQNCKSWGSQAGGEASRYLCKLDFEPALYTQTALESVPYPTAQQKQCSFDRVYKGMCVTKLWGATLPSHSEYWTEASGMAGLSSQMDYCPVVVPEPSLSYSNKDFMVDCRDQVGGPAAPTTRFFEEFSEASRCFETTTLGNSDVFTSCLVHKCTKDGLLHIKVKDETKVCPTDGGKLTFQQSGIVVDCSGYTHLCGSYAQVTKPTISVISPLDSVVVSTRDLEASLLIDNYEDDHVLKIFVNDVLYETVSNFKKIGFGSSTSTSTFVRQQLAPDESMLTTVALGNLPVRARSSQNSVKLTYQLTKQVSGADVVLSSVETNHFVKNDLEQWATAVNASSEHPQFPLEEGLAVAEDAKGWLPKQVLEKGANHYVVVSLDQEVQLNSVSVYYNFGFANQQLKSVRVSNLDESSGFVMVWKGNETQPAASDATTDTVTFDSAPFFSKLVKLEFDGAQWMEVDAIKCAGYLTVVPTFHVDSQLVVDLPGGGTQNATRPELFYFDLPFTSAHLAKSSTIFWEA